MSNHINAEILIVGAGPMSEEYAKVLKALNKSFLIVGRGEERVKILKEKVGENVIAGGLNSYINSSIQSPSHAIIATGVEALFDNAVLLIKAGVKNILTEKPGCLTKDEATKLSLLASEYNSNVLVAYNRRFYSSVLKGLEIIEQDGGMSSILFEFTEWSHVIEPLKKGAGVKEHWFLANSTHVADLAFFFSGKPKDWKSYTSGSLSWHPSASSFSGSGVTERNVLFNYIANWEAPGRWAIEVLTNQHRLYFKPIEKLQIQNKGSVVIEPVQIDDTLDIQFKPGLFKMTEAFINGHYHSIPSIQEQSEMMEVYYQMANYK